MHAQQMPESVTLELIALTTAYENSGSIVVPVQSVVSELGLEDVESFKYTADPERELLLATMLYERVDGRAEPHGRALRIGESGASRSTTAVLPPHDVDEGLGIDLGTVGTTKAEGVPLAVYAGRADIDGETQPVIAFAHRPTISVATERFAE